MKSDHHFVVVLNVTYQNHEGSKDARQTNQLGQAIAWKKMRFCSQKVFLDTCTRKCFVTCEFNYIINKKMLDVAPVVIRVRAVNLLPFSMCVFARHVTGWLHEGSAVAMSVTCVHELHLPPQKRPNTQHPHSHHHLFREV